MTKCNGFSPEFKREPVRLLENLAKGPADFVLDLGARP